MATRKMFCNYLYTIGLSILFLLAAGCSSPQIRIQHRLNQVPQESIRQILQTNLNAAGGLDAWAGIQELQADAVATILAEDNSRSLVRQKLFLKPTAQTIEITLTSLEPDGVWLERLDRRGRIIIAHNPGNALQAVRITEPQVLQGAALKLRLLTQAMTQTIGFLQKDYNVAYAGQERKGGRLADKIEITGPIVLLPKKIVPEVSNENQLTAWIDVEKSLITRLWMKYINPLDQQKTPIVYMAANVGQYQTLPEGITVPAYIDFTHSDSYQQFSERRILTMELKNFQVTKTK